MKQCLKIVVVGKVIGVGYRHFVWEQAKLLGVEGIIQNEENGTVQILACGDSAKLDKFIEILYKGSKKSHVENVAAEPLTLHKDFRGVFRIIGVNE